MSAAVYPVAPGYVVGSVSKVVLVAVPVVAVVWFVPFVPVLSGVAVSAVSWLAVSSGLLPESLAERACAVALAIKPNITTNAPGLTMPPTSVAPLHNAREVHCPLRSKVGVEDIVAMR